MKNAPQRVVQQLTLQADTPLATRIELAQRSLASAIEQAKWKGGRVECDATVMVAVLGFMRELAGQVDELKAEESDVGDNGKALIIADMPPGQQAEANE